MICKVIFISGFDTVLIRTTRYCKWLQELSMRLIEEEPEMDSPIRPRRTYQIDEVKDFLGISRNHAYAMAREGAFPVIRLGRRLVVPRKQFDAWLAGEGGPQ